MFSFAWLVTLKSVFYMVWMSFKMSRKTLCFSQSERELAICWSRFTVKSEKEFRVIMLHPCIAKLTLLLVVVFHAWIHFCQNDLFPWIHQKRKDATYRNPFFTSYTDISGILISQICIVNKNRIMFFVSSWTKQKGTSF